MRRKPNFDPTAWDWNTMQSVKLKRQPWWCWKYGLFLSRVPNISYPFFIFGFFATFLSSWLMIYVPVIKDYSIDTCTISLISEVVDTRYQSQNFPRVVVFIEPIDHVYAANISSTINRYKSVRIDPNSDKYPSKRLIDPLGNVKLQKAIDYDDNYYGNQLLDSDITEDCQFRYNWQKVSTIPTCNRIHEFDVSSLSWEISHKT
jgi:hypothetical protein